MIDIHTKPSGRRSGEKKRERERFICDIGFCLCTKEGAFSLRSLGGVNKIVQYNV